MGVSSRGQTADKVSGTGPVQTFGDRDAEMPERRVVQQIAVLRAYYAPHQLYR